MKVYVNYLLNVLTLKELTLISVKSGLTLVLQMVSNVHLFLIDVQITIMNQVVQLTWRKLNANGKKENAMKNVLNHRKTINLIRIVNHLVRVIVRNNVISHQRILVPYI